MPWYYAGPEAKPVGPVTLEELHACRVRGIVTPDTYVIEHTGQPDASWAWKRYQDIFPSGHSLPPLPAPPPQHPVFPTDTRPDPYYNVKPTNGWCAWGFGLGLTGFFFSFLCIGLI